MITAPYNFVPLNKEVFYPSWTEDVSHDIPFKDGESGEIKLTLTAKSPIFIRNHYQDGDEYYINKENQKISKEFCHIKKNDSSKEYYIPSSSIKGVVRNVLEIMSFGEIRIDKEKWAQPLSVRDMTQDRWTGTIFKHPMVATAQQCGFLVKKNEDYYIKDCGKVLTISYNDVKEATQEWLKNVESVKEKYKKVPNRNIHFRKQNKKMKMGHREISKKIAVYDPSSSMVGELVFTGQIDNKKHEFVFYENGQEIKLRNEVVQNFEKAYFQDKNSEIGQFWKGKNNIPIFYITDKKGNIQDIGLTQIFKLAYHKTILEASKQNTKNGKKDLSQTIFGYVDGTDALKGRVYFSHLKSNTIRFEKPKKEILGSPKPTYYPNYIEQLDTQGNKVKTYTTLMDGSATIRGYKRYPLQPHIQSSQITNDNENIATQFKPLDSGTVFEGKIRFHNMKKEEIGALLAALTFFGNENTHFHNLGMAKPLGFGKVKIELQLNDLKYTKQEYIEAFENMMDIWEEKPYKQWINSLQIQELLAINNNNNAKKFRYQMLENPNSSYKVGRNEKQEKNEFVGAKKYKEYLQPFSGHTVQKTKQPFKKKKLQDTSTNFQDLLKKYQNNLLQIFSALKDGHLDNFNTKQIAQELLKRMKQDPKLSNSQKKKDLERFTWLENFLVS